MLTAQPFKCKTRRYSIIYTAEDHWSPAEFDELDSRTCLQYGQLFQCYLGMATRQNLTSSCFGCAMADTLPLRHKVTFPLMGRIRSVKTRFIEPIYKHVNGCDFSTAITVSNEHLFQNDNLKQLASWTLNLVIHHRCSTKKASYQVSRATGSFFCSSWLFHWQEPSSHWVHAVGV